MCLVTGGSGKGEAPPGAVSEPGRQRTDRRLEGTVLHIF